MKLVNLPQDGNKHKCNVEWWYFNGLLQDKSGHRYSFMDCFFSVDNKKVNIPIISKIPKKDFYFAHSILSDLDKQKSYPQINYYAVTSRDSFERPLFFVNYLSFKESVSLKGYCNNLIEEIAPFDYHIKTSDIDLILKSNKAPLLEAGTGFIKLNSKTSYYYSLTDLSITGKITIGKNIIDVTGKGWFDHQWANTKFTNDKWTWFSIQLDNNIEIVCYEYDDFKVKDRQATIIYKDGKQSYTEKVDLIPAGESWKSADSGAIYPMDWQIKLPDKGFDLRVSTLIHEQEMLFGNINYWEGPLRVTGTCHGKKVKGQGFMELVGYPVTKSKLQILENRIWKKISK